MTTCFCGAALGRIGVPAEAVRRLCFGDDEFLMIGPLSLSIQDDRVFAYDHESDVESDDSDPAFEANISAYVKALIAGGARWSFLDQEAPLVVLASLSMRDRHEVVA